MTKQSIGIIGLGYVGLPLAVAFAKHFKVIGYDINANRISKLRQMIVRSLELTKEAIQAFSSLYFRKKTLQYYICIDSNIIDI